MNNAISLSIYLCDTGVLYGMNPHTRETANFSQMDATIRELGSWSPRPEQKTPDRRRWGSRSFVGDPRS